MSCAWDDGNLTRSTVTSPLLPILPTSSPSPDSCSLRLAPQRLLLRTCAIIHIRSHHTVADAEDWVPSGEFGRLHSIPQLSSEPFFGSHGITACSKKHHKATAAVVERGLNLRTQSLKALN